jgi:transcriptional regulator with XRE-family HTH domain
MKPKDSPKKHGIGRRIKSLREARGLTLEQLGERMGGVDRSFLSRLENNPISNPTLGVLERVSAALSVNVTELLS